MTLFLCRSESLEEENWDEPESKTEKVVFHKYPLPVSTIHVLSTESDFEEFLSTGLEVRR